MSISLAIIDAAIALNEGLVDDAKRNLVAAGLFDADSDYGGMLGKAVLDLTKTFSKQGHSGCSAGMTLELFNKVINRRPLTTEFWHEEKQRLVQWLKDEEQYDSMTPEMVNRFILDSLGPCPKRNIEERKMVDVNAMIERVVNGEAASEVIHEQMFTEKGEEGGKPAKVDGWLGYKLQGKTATGKDSTEKLPKMKTTKDHKTQASVKRAMIAGLFRSMKKQGKDIGKMTGD